MCLPSIPEDAGPGVALNIRSVRHWCRLGDTYPIVTHIYCTAKERVTAQKRHEVGYGEVAVLGRFYKSEHGRVAYRKLPTGTVVEHDHGHIYPADIHSWVREDWTGKVETAHSWSVGEPANVWVEED